MDRFQFQQLLARYRYPPNRGRLKKANLICRQANLSCGDRVTLYLKIDRHNRVQEAKFINQGCVISTAAASLLTEAIKGKTLAEIQKFRPEEIISWLKIPLTPGRHKCALLPFQALLAGINQFLNQPKQVKKRD